MKNKLPKILFLALIGVLANTWFHARGRSEQTRNTSPAPPILQEHTVKRPARPPVAEFGDVPSESPEAHQQRQIRESLVKGLYRRTIVDPGTMEVRGQAETQNLTFIDGVTILKPGERPDPPGLPVSSTAIVIGTVIDGKAFVSEDYTFVYSDYQTQVSEVLKPDSDRTIPVGDQITTWVTGGSIHFPSGHIKHFIVAGRSFPEIGTQYLFFLRRTDPRLNSYAISTAYAFKDGVIQQLDERQDARPFDGMRVTDFLDTVRKAITTAQAGGGQQGN